jgi:hypothetical protein
MLSTERLQNICSIFDRRSITLAKIGAIARGGKGQNPGTRFGLRESRAEVFRPRQSQGVELHREIRAKSQNDQTG